MACELVDKLPYDDDLKGKFCEDLRSFLFDKHRSFLSNPLLLSIMLLTYGQSANIPDKLNVFYNQAYEALFERHDALKGGYSRARKTKLDIQDFARLFSAFCLQTYDKNQLEFSRLEALSFAEKASHIVGIKTNKEDFLKDCLQAVCLLVEEGLQIVFSHRSFQEYFTARFISESSPNVQEKLIAKYSSRMTMDSVLSLLYEIRPDIIEKHLLLPKLDKLCEVIGYVNAPVTVEHFLKFMQAAHSKMQFGQIESENFSGFVNEKDTHGFSKLSSFIKRFCAANNGFKESKKTKADTKFLLQKYGTVDGSLKVYELNAFTKDDAFIIDLAKHGNFFSIERLQMLIDVREALKMKTAEKESSLDAMPFRNSWRLASAMQGFAVSRN